jgi:hypothetical protein
MVQRYLNVPVQDTVDAMDAALANDPYLKHIPMRVQNPRPSLARHIQAHAPRTSEDVGNQLRVDNL